MPWPERDLTTRVLGGIVGGVLAALLVFFILADTYLTLATPTARLWVGVAVGASLGFVAGFAGGDSAIRFLARLFRLGRPAA